MTAASGNKEFGDFDEPTAVNWQVGKHAALSAFAALGEDQKFCCASSDA